MPEQLTKEQQDLSARALEFAREHLLPRINDSDASSTSSLIKASQAAGFYQMTQRRSLGGSEANSLDLCIVREAFASIYPEPLAGLLGPSPGVLADCKEPLRSTHLHPLLAGEKRSAFGFTEPKDGTPPTSGVIKGDQIIVSGLKSYVSGGDTADFINTLVRIDGMPAMLVIDTASPGVEILRKFESLDGSTHCAIQFKEVKVPLGHLISEPGKGMPAALGQIGATRLAFAADCSGRVLWLMEWLTQYLGETGQDGKPRGHRESVRLRFGQMMVEAYAIRSVVYRSTRIAASDPTNKKAGVNEGMAAKIMATEGLQRLLDQAIQLVGGHALELTHPLARLYKQVRGLRLAEGATDILYTNIARGRLDLDSGRV